MTLPPDPTPPSWFAQYSSGGLLSKLQLLRELIQQLHTVLGDIEDSLYGAEGATDDEVTEDDEGMQADDASEAGDGGGPEKP